MDYGFLLDIALIIIVVKIFTIITQKIHMPRVLGGLIAGIVLGPAVLNIVHETSILNALAKFGIILIMFLAGMETSIKRFISDSKKFFIIAVLGIIVPFSFGILASKLYTDSFSLNLFFGAVITATSVSITVETLIEMKKIKTNVGMAILGAGVVDDIIGIIFLTLIINNGNLTLSSLSLIALKIILFFIIAIISGFIMFKFFEKLEKVDYKSDKLPIFSIAFALLLAYLAEKLGVSGIIGAYIAGLVIGNTEKGRTVKNKIDVLVYMLFSPIFFASIGLKLITLDLPFTTWLFIIFFTIVTILSKVIGNGIGALICGYDNQKSIQIGIGMATRGEVALIMADEAKQNGLIDNEIFSIVIITILLITLITPIILHFSFKSKNLSDEKA